MTGVDIHCAQVEQHRVIISGKMRSLISQVSYIRRVCLEFISTYLGHGLRPSSLSSDVVEETVNKIGSGVGLVTPINEVVEEGWACRCESSKQKDDQMQHTVVDNARCSVIGLFENSKENCSSVGGGTAYVV
jgi:hypothetical protein